MKKLGKDTIRKENRHQFLHNIKTHFAAGYVLQFFEINN